MLHSRQKGPKLKSLSGINVIIKGSASSGHYGHLGRPGEVGGSQPGALRSSSIVNPKYFQTKKWKYLTSEIDAQMITMELEEILKRNNVHSNHLRGLTKITIHPHSDAGTKGYHGANGHYHNEEYSIHLVE